MIKVFIKEWGTDIWEEYTDNLGRKIPDLSDRDTSSLANFTLMFQDLDDSLIDFETGWDLAVCDYESDGTFIGIRDDKMLGKITRVETREVYGYSEYDDDRMPGGQPLEPLQIRTELPGHPTLESDHAG